MRFLLIVFAESTLHTHVLAYTSLSLMHQIKEIGVAIGALANGVNAVNNVLLTISTSALVNGSALTGPVSQVIGGENTTVGGAVARVAEAAPQAIRDTASNISTNVCKGC